ncbi:MAG: TolC family protein [Methylacidiphilales bacterium]|nr:TolC family protein [Candidatus Methylacidiphilales bacterium]
MKRVAFGVLMLCAVHAAQGESPSSPPSTPEPSVRASAPVQLRTGEEAGLRFTLKEAEAYALANHPQIAAANLNADAVRQEIREARSQFFPQVYAESDSVYAPYDAKGEVQTRIGAGGSLSNSSVYTRQSDGVTISQLLTDFGHTYELTESAHFRASAAEDRVRFARAVVILEVDRAYFDLLRAHAVLQVANETVHTRQVAYDQISALAKNQLKSILDADFAQVNLSEAKLLLIQSQSGVSDAEAVLSTAMGFPDAQHFVLAEEPLDTNLPTSPEDLIQQALHQRPELANLHNEEEAAQRFAKAQDAAQYPKISALAAAGVNPVAPGTEFHHNYYAAGINVEVPLFNGGNLSAQADEAHYLAEAAIKNLVDAQNTISRDVRQAWLSVSTARERLPVTAQLVQTAQEEEKLANARYRLGTSSIVELTEAELNYTETQLQDTSARYDFQSGCAVLNFAIGNDFPALSAGEVSSPLPSKP